MKCIGCLNGSLPFHNSPPPDCPDTDAVSLHFFRAIFLLVSIFLQLFQLCLGLPNYLFPLVFETEDLYTHLLSTMLTTCPACLFFHISSCVVCFSPSWYSINSCFVRSKLTNNTSPFCQVESNATICHHFFQQIAWINICGLQIAVIIAQTALDCQCTLVSKRCV